VFLVGASLDMLGYIDTENGWGLLVLLPAGLFELLLPLWLFAKGFSSSAFQPKPADDDMGLLKNSRRKITSCLGYSLVYHLIEASNGITKSGGVPILLRSFLNKDDKGYERIMPKFSILQLLICVETH
jgi:hypothetical protein